MLALRKYCDSNAEIMITFSQFKAIIGYSKVPEELLLAAFVNMTDKYAFEIELANVRDLIDTVLSD